MYSKVYNESFRAERYFERQDIKNPGEVYVVQLTFKSRKELRSTEYIRGLMLTLGKVLKISYSIEQIIIKLMIMDCMICDKIFVCVNFRMINNPKNKSNL